MARKRQAKSRRNKNTHSDTLPRLPQQAQALTTCVPIYKPRDFGHPHEEAEPQATEPFYHQLPPWARPGYQLYYYPGYGYFDHPLYSSSRTPDGGVLVGSYGSGFRFNRPPSLPKAALAGGQAKSRVLEMVDVFLLDEFIQEVPLKLLTRFSGVARAAFPRPRKSRIGGEDTTADGSNTRNEGVDSVIEDVDEICLHIRETYLEEPDRFSISTLCTTPETGASNRTRSETKSTNMTSPDATTSTPTGKQRSPRGKSSHHVKAKSGKKELRLDLDVIDMPPKEVILWAIAWMKSNESFHGDATMYFGPPDLKQISLDKLMDLYQASLAFRLLPCPKRLREELNERITNLQMTLHTFRFLARRLPLGDPCMTRAINSLQEHWHRVYSPAERGGFAAFLAEPQNEELSARVHELSVLYLQHEHWRETKRWDRRIAYLAKETEKEKCRSQEKDEGKEVNVDLEAHQGQQEEEAAGLENDTMQKGTKRGRRLRRK